MPDVDFAGILAKEWNTEKTIWSFRAEEMDETMGNDTSEPEPEHERYSNSVSPVKTERHQEEPSMLLNLFNTIMQRKSGSKLSRKYFALPPLPPPKDDKWFVLVYVLDHLRWRAHNSSRDTPIHTPQADSKPKKRKANEIWWQGDWKCSRCGNHVPLSPLFPSPFDNVPPSTHFPIHTGRRVECKRCKFKRLVTSGCLPVPGLIPGRLTGGFPPTELPFKTPATPSPLTFAYLPLTIRPFDEISPLDGATDAHLSIFDKFGLYESSNSSTESDGSSDHVPDRSDE
ncbi:Aste57867_23008 [Aphanomyces stellatus]|uniref:Aste57867_23008 protein n=1 Tax=Aphanomyces stellatus TaxID=120398 RepID=A0A485LM25_9STRA|nr:hypothetical protein As57867_022937 [Aphanomyces stellatus]VFT99656.1 Aste57867_23008 [Aphanomyces stellatus]